MAEPASWEETPKPDGDYVLVWSSIFILIIIITILRVFDVHKAPVSILVFIILTYSILYFITLSLYLSPLSFQKGYNIPSDTVADRIEGHLHAHGIAFHSRVRSPMGSAMGRLKRVEEEYVVDDNVIIEITRSRPYKSLSMVYVSLGRKRGSDGAMEEWMRVLDGVLSNADTD